MKTLLSLPQNLLSSYKDVCRPAQQDYFVSSDPDGIHLGSGGGTAWILQQYQKAGGDISAKKLLIHAGGQGRRLPAYSACGKIFTPVPVFRWKTGQKIDQTLLDIQTEFYGAVLERANPAQNLMVASGDVLLRCAALPSQLPDADIVVLTTWIDSNVATRHGVIFARHESPNLPDFMLQKPSAQKIEQLLDTHLFMLDTGCWVLSDKAVHVLLEQCTGPDGTVCEYDFYTEFGAALGSTPVRRDTKISGLTCAVVNLDGGEFYHYGTSRELISSTEKIQSLITNPRDIIHKKVKAQTSVFVQNSHARLSWTAEQKNIWIENSYLADGWRLMGDNVITGVPKNNWSITIPKGVCVDVVPMGDTDYALRPYGMDDAFRGGLQDKKTLWLGRPFCESAVAASVAGDCDLQCAPVFPVVRAERLETDGYRLLQFLLGADSSGEAKKLYDDSPKLSADQLLSRANVRRLHHQREQFLKENLVLLARNYGKSVFYQCDLAHTQDLYKKFSLESPAFVPTGNALTDMRERMFIGDDKNAFRVLQETVISAVQKVLPAYDIITDQIVWGRSPARIDLAGGWSDTPPYCMYKGGAVTSIAIDLNGQQPIQTYIRLIPEPYFVLRSIDTGAREVIADYTELETFSTVGSSFSIPKAALSLAGFSQRFCQQKYKSLEEQLASLGGGLEITTLAAIPKGSGLGTSSIIASTLLGTLSNVCRLGWSEQEICFRTLALEQLLTTGGGWQDQYGGVYGGIKLCTSESGIQNAVQVRRLPTNIITDSTTSGLWLLYYTGITRIAKTILADIVRNMFLNKGETLSSADEIRQHGFVLADAIQFCDYGRAARLIKESWQLNKRLDSGVSTPEIDSLIRRIDDYSLGHKLAGAGGGGYLLMCAKDIEAAARIKKELTEHPLNGRSRFVTLSLNQSGLEITRS